MQIVIVDFSVTPENMRLAQATLADEAPIVRAMPGNLGYSVWCDPDIAGKLRLMHEWSNTANFEAYKATPVFKAVGAVLFPMMTGKPSSRLFEASEVI